MRTVCTWLAFICFFSFPCRSRAAEHGTGLIFRASLEKSTTADVAGGDREPLTDAGVRVDAGAAVPPNACLTYDARANLYAEQGTVSFWWRPDEPLGRLGFPLFLASFEQHSTWDYTFARIDWNGSELGARIRDRNMQFHSVRAAAQPAPGKWMHVALTWSESGGVALYLDGKTAGSAGGPLQLDARLDQFGLLCRAVTPHHTAGSENPGAVAEVRVYQVALGAAEVARLALRQEPSPGMPEPADMKRRLGWTEAANVPSGDVFTVKRVPVEIARDVRKFCFKGLDGKRETIWPVISHGYVDEGKAYRIQPVAEPVNLLRMTGDLRGRFTTASGAAFRRDGKGELLYHLLPKPGTLKWVNVDRESGFLGDLEFLLVEPKAGPAGSGWTRFTPTADTTFRARRAPGAFAVWKAGEAGAGAAAGYHYFSIPAGGMALDAVRLRMPATPGAYYYVSVGDPVAVARELIQFDVRAKGGSVDVTLDFPDVLVPVGRDIVITLASSDPAPPRLDAQLIPADPARARRQHMAERILHIRDSFQMLSEARPWMRIGRGLTRTQLRRQLKLVDELFALLEDARAVEAGHPIVTAYWSWINRFEAPPPYEAPPADSAVPVWARQQLVLLKQFRQVVDWWIDNRQIETGEIGGGLGDDTDMVQNWPAVALLDGPSEKIRDSVRRVVEACYAQGLIDRGMNARRTDALHAYEEGMNAYAPAFLLDYGNPVLFERMMETASHYARLTGVNNAGHRHFRSYQYSSTDVVEEGYHAREDAWSHLILHPGLYVAWYNGSPSVTGLLKEMGDGLLAHWKNERYPRLAKVIFFAGDRVESYSAPSSETFNLFWGIRDLTRDPEYLWLLREAVNAGDVSQAAFTNGMWLDQFDSARLREPLAREAARRNLFDHNLQTDQLGTVARVLAFQAGGDVSMVEEAQRALVQHMTQNMHLYTEAEQFTDRIWIPTLATQRERLGGVAHYRNYIYPGHAVSWEDTGGEVAALVSAAAPDRLRMTLFHAGASPRRATARVWQLDNGQYEVVLKDSSGAVLSSRRMALKRFAPIALELPARRAVTLEARQLEKGVPLSSLPDLAIAAEEIRSGQALEVPVHNIGAVESGNYTVAVRDASGNVLAESKQPSLAAPVDLKAKVAVARFPGVNVRPGLRITVRTEAGEEITEANNEVLTR